jgi:hypothetical protein
MSSFMLCLTSEDFMNATPAVLRALSLLLLTLPITTINAQIQSFGVCKPVAERKSDAGCWILTDKSVGRALRQAS